MPLRRSPLRLLALLHVVLLVGSCGGTDAPTGVANGEWSARLPISPALIPSPADASARPVNRIRASVQRVPDGALLGEAVVDVSPTASQWTVDLSARLSAPTVDVTITVYLVNVAAQAETIEFSGRVGPLTLTRGSGPIVAPDIPLVRGPLANLFATGATITSAPDTLTVGQSATLLASLTTSATTPPTPYWTVLDSAILSSAGPVVTGLAPGTGRVVVSAGAFSDTASIVVRAVATGGPDARVFGSASDATPTEGDAVQIGVSVENVDQVGATAMTNLVLAHRLGAGATLSGATPSQGSFNTQTGVWTVGNLGVDVTATLTLDLQVDLGAVGQTVIDSVWITSLDQTQVELSNDTLVVSLAVEAGTADVAIEKTVDVVQPLEGAAVTFTVAAVNRGVGPVTNLSVFDTLPSAFIGRQDSVSAGSLVGDSLWVIPSLAGGDTATWTITATVATGVAGDSATNRAILRALAQNDTTPANDTAAVTLNFPLSAVPVVQITQPADSAVFDPGDLVTFVASAADTEDGDLSPSIVWTSSVDGAFGTGRTIGTSTLRTGVHTIVASATDTDGGVGADTIRVTISLYTVPPTLNVPYGGTASLPITLSEPAPAGGVTLSVASDDGSVTTPTSSTVSIPAGAQSANATLSGLLPGTANVTVGHPQYGAAVTAVSVRAALNILVSNLSTPVPFSQSITIQFESQGTAIAAPAGGLPVTLTSSVPACVSVTSPRTIPAGQVNTTATVSYGGSATPTCQAYVYATSPGIVTDSVLVSITPAPQILVSPRTVGSGLQESTSGALNATNHGGVTLTLTSSNPGTILLSPNATTAGSASIDIAMANGTNGYSFYVQAVEGATGTSTVTASAPGFVDGTTTMTAVQPALMLAGLPATTTTLSPNSAVYAYVGAPSGNSVNAQNIRAGGSPLQVTFTNTGVGVLTDGTTSGAVVTADIAVGLYYTPFSVATGGVAYDPVTAGSASITVTSPGVTTQPAGTQSVTVSAPQITLSPRTVGSGLQEGSGGTLNATNHGGVTLTLTSSNPGTILLSPNATTAGSASIDIAMANGTNSYGFYVQGVEGAIGTATVTASAPGFVDGTTTMTAVQPALMLAGLPATTTTLSPNSAVYAYVGTPTGNSVNAQNIRAGGSPLQVTFTNTGVGVLTDGTTSGAVVTADIAVGLYYTPFSVATGGVAYDPVTAGSASITVTAPGVTTQPAGTQSVTVSAPQITSSPRTVGSGLQEGSGGALNASNHGGVTLTLTSSNPGTILLSPNATTAGSASIDINMANGTNSYSFYVQGVEGATGTATVTASAPGFVDGTTTMSAVRPGIILAGLPATTTTLSPDNALYAYVGTPSGNTVNAQNIRAGGSPLQVTFTNTGVGVLTDGTISGAVVTADIAVGLYYTPFSVATGGVAYDPQAAGSASVTATAPGVTTQTGGTQSVTVSAPQITLSARTVGSGLQENTGGALNASNHGGVTLRLTSSNPAALLLSPNATTAGSASIDIAMANGANSYGFYVQAVEGATGTATVTASAPGFVDGTTTMTAVQPALVLAGLPTTTTAGAADIAMYAYVGTPSGSTVNAQNRRAGGSPLIVTATTTNGSVSRLVTQTQSGASVTATVAVGVYYTPFSVATGGFAFDPLAVGQTTVSVSAPGFITQPSGTVVVTINP